MRYRAQKSLGQNFINDDSVIFSAINAAEISGEDLIVEIGPGTGKLTEPLLGLARQVIGIELDQDLALKLSNHLKDFDNFSLITEDARHVDYGKVTNNQSYKIMSNLPYYAATFFLRTFLELNHKPELMVLMFQKEVADNVLASPGSMRLLSVITQILCNVERVCDVPKEAFEPSPKVDSSIIKLIPKTDDFITSSNYVAFCDLLRAGFSSPRKTISNSLSIILKKPKPECIAVLNDCYIDPLRRAETLELAEWEFLFNNGYSKLFNSGE